jgi:hypothetical protein
LGALLLRWLEWVGASWLVKIILAGVGIELDLLKYLLQRKTIDWCSAVRLLHKSITLRVGRQRFLGEVLKPDLEAKSKTGIKLKSLILAQIERWRNALHMQVERQRGATWRRAANG